MRMRIAVIQQTTRPTTDQELSASARELRTQIRENVRRQIDAARAQAGAEARAGTPAPPTPPAPVLAGEPEGTQRTVITVPPFSFDARNTIPPQAVDISIAFFLTVAAIIIGLPLARAFARRMDRRGGSAQVPAEVVAQLNHLGQAVDAIALEVERISEGQRFTTRLLSEQRDAARQTLPSSLER
jgi:hypothetical protein